MKDLARDFFVRDLDDAEWAELGRQLAAEDAVNDRFLEQAGAYYRGLGLPEPKQGAGPGGALGGMKGLAIGLLLGAAAGTGATLWLRRAPRPEALVPAAPAAPLPTPEPTPLPRAASHPVPVQPQPTLAPPRGAAVPRVASPGFPGLAAVVELSRQGLVTARVLGADGTEVKLLFAGLLDPGRWSFGWDGKDEAGRTLPAGAYSIEVQEGSRVLKKTVLMQAKGAE
jgi:hypothetical protein